jgi:hypothetical protein
MADDKKIIIGAGIDSSSLEKDFQLLEERIKKFHQTQNRQNQSQSVLKRAATVDPEIGKYAKAAFDRNESEHRKGMQQENEKLRAEVMGSGKAVESIQKKVAQYKEELKAVNLTTEAIRKKETALKALNAEEDRHTKIVTNATRELEAKGGLKEPPAGPTPPGGDSGQSSPSAGPGAFKKLLQGIGVASIISGALNAVVTGVEDSITRERKIAMNRAAAMNMGSREMREGMSGQGSRGMFWNPERARAMQSAAHEQGNQSNWDTAKAWGGTALQIGGAATMALTGWTGLGAAAGAGMMAGGTAMKGGIIGDERSRSAMWDREKFNSLQTKEGLEKYEQNFAAEQAKNPRRQIAREYFEQNREQMMNTQKLAGLGTDRELTGADTRKEGQNIIEKGTGSRRQQRRGIGVDQIVGQEMVDVPTTDAGVGLMQRQMGYGKQFGGVNFSEKTIQDQMQALASGGAMTEGVREMGGAAATYNRQFNLSNAGQTMGKMQGNAGGNSAVTDMAYQRLLAEAVRLGVDASSMPRELEKMTQITAELSTSGGVNAKGMTDLFGQGLYGLDQKSMGAAAGAAETFKSTAKEAGGWEGQMGMGFLQSDKAKDLMGGKSLSSKDMNYINQLSASEMGDEDFQRVGEYLKDKDGNAIGAEKAKQLLQQKDKFKQGRTGEEDKVNKDLGEFLKSQGPMTREERDEALSTGKGAELFTAAEATRGQTHGGFMGKDMATRRAEVLMEANVAADNQPGIELSKAEQAVADQKKKAETRAGFVEEGAVATGDMARIEALNEQLENFKTAAKGYSTSAVEYNKQFDLMVAATKAGAGKMQDIADHLTRLEDKMKHDGAGTVPGAKPASDGRPH